MPRMTKRTCTLVLHDIRSVHNTGSIFRSADGAGVSHIILSGYTPGPLDHKGKARQDFAKVALGAEHTVPWERSEKPLAEIVEDLRTEGLEICALECDSRAQDILSYTPQTSFALILGNEVDGVPKEILREADTILSIPMRGSKSSLNVSVAAGVALYALLQK